MNKCSPACEEECEPTCTFKRCPDAAGPGEKDPSGLEPGQSGAKLDSGKTLAALVGDFGLALLAVAEVGTFGANKYSRGGWQSVPEGVQRYGDAMWRHQLKGNQEPVDPESGLPHEYHMVWNALAKLELRLREERKKVDNQ